MLHKRIELELAIAFGIAAKPASFVCRGVVGIGALDRAVGQEPAKLECADAVELAVLDLDRRKHAGVDVRRDGEIAVRADLPMIGRGDLEPLAGRIIDVGHQPAGHPVRRGADAEHREQRQVDAEQLKPPALEADAVVGGVVDHPRRGDAPARPARAAGRRGHRAGRVNRIFERGDVAGANSARRGDPAAAFEHDQQIFDRPVAQAVGEHDILADQLVALRSDQDDIALGSDLAALAVPNDLVGGQIIAFARHAHLAGRGDEVGVAVVSDLVGAEADDLVGRRAPVEAPGRGGWLFCAVAAAERASNSGSAVQQTNVLPNAAPYARLAFSLLPIAP